ncbi:MAG: hypothetical protein KGH59_04905 [Candidatus Micrarchaeota archaeon]|nr:hypothetical protein [Candidatus Micrarchaeota archaeon]MDE1805088.1 hypothetical protein [Candidatus Micrarchaeota archaeon]MDE1847044.1 hypothetical protein [Candidatus Micrarchaeota archaeon]
MDRKSIREVTLEEAKELIGSSTRKFVWLLGPTRVSIPEALDVSDTQVLSIEPEEILGFDEPRLNALKGSVLVCAHGNTSAAVAIYLKGKNVEAYSLKGGVAAIIGENY